MAVMEVFCFLRFGGAFGTLGTAAIMAPSQRATAERSEEMCAAFALAALTEGGSCDHESCSGSAAVRKRRLCVVGS